MQFKKFIFIAFSIITFAPATIFAQSWFPEVYESYESGGHTVLGTVNVLAAHSKMDNVPQYYCAQPNSFSYNGQVNFYSFSEGWILRPSEWSVSDTPYSYLTRISNYSPYASGGAYGPLNGETATRYLKINDTWTAWDRFIGPLMGRPSYYSPGPGPYGPNSTIVASNVCLSQVYPQPPDSIESLGLPSFAGLDWNRGDGGMSLDTPVTANIAVGAFVYDSDQVGGNDAHEESSADAVITVYELYCNSGEFQAGGQCVHVSGSLSVPESCQVGIPCHIEWDSNSTGDVQLRDYNQYYHYYYPNISVSGASGSVDAMLSEGTHILILNGKDGYGNVVPEIASRTVTVVADPNAPIAGQCGDTNGVSYPVEATEYSPLVQCYVGNSSNPSFPEIGATLEWTCSGVNGASPSLTCSATHLAESEPVNNGMLVPQSNFCDIAENENSCQINFSWSVVSDGDTVIVLDGGYNTVGTGNTGSYVPFTVPYNSATFYLFNIDTVLDQKTVAADCVSGTFWNGSLCERDPIPPEEPPVSGSSGTLTITKSGNGTVKSVDGNINCGGTCSYDYDSNTSVTLKATPNSTYWRFTGWSGDCSGLGTCILTIDGNKNANASFGPRTLDYKEF